MDLERVRTPAQIAAVAALARETWTRHYVPIIGVAQVEYMLEKFQSEEAIARQIASATGPSGRNRDYVLHLADALRALGADDAHVFAVERHLRAPAPAEVSA